MKKLAVAVVLVLSLFALSAAAGEWSGYISDVNCAKAGKGASDDHAKCAQSCAKRGNALVLVSDGKVIKIANQDKVQDHAGHKVTITGKLDGDTLTVDNVKM